MTNPQSTGTDIALPLPNPLSTFRSFNSIFTLSCLSSEQINFPDTTYRSGDISQLGSIVLRSGGGFPDARVATAYKSDYNRDGKFEFYIESLDFEAILSYNKETGGSNATSFNFEVVEPYSMGVFLQSLQLSAIEAGQMNYLEAPFLLTIEFIGYNIYDQASEIPLTRRYLPIKLSNMGMEVTAAGCKYRIEAIAWNEQALTDTNNLLKTDVAIAGSTVQELLQSGKNSLQAQLNARLKEIPDKEKTKSIPDEILIVFPKEIQSGVAGSETDDSGSATINPSNRNSQSVLKKLAVTGINSQSLSQSTSDLNEIGAASMGFDLTTPGQSWNIDDAPVWDESNKRYSRGKISYDPKTKLFMFAQGTSIVNAISEVLLMSEFCKTAASENKKDSKNTGMKTWFRIETQVYNLEPTDGNKGKQKTPKLLVYRVVPYNVHSSRFISPTSPAEGYEQLKKSAVKEYNYIYTGKNEDVLEFNISLSAGFFTTVYADLGQANRDLILDGRQGAGQSQLARTTPDNENYGVPQESGVPGAQQGELLDTGRKAGGGPGDDPRSLVARQFQNALLNSPVDLVTGELTIMGDPYFIADSGLGNFSDSGSKLFNLTSSGAIDYQSGEVDIILNFRTPLDIDSNTGIMDFGNTQLVEGFSGLYQVMTLENKFAQSKFTQTLKLTRRPKQTTFNEEVALKYGTSSGSQQTSMLAEQDAWFEDTNENVSATTNPSDKKSAVASTTQNNKTTLSTGTSSSSVVTNIATGKSFT